jgi:hypothetical protein
VERPPVNEFRVYRPSAVSAFFAYQVGLVAAGFWAWLVLLTIEGGRAAQWQPVAATGAGTATMVGVVLGIRFALQRNAAARHEQVMQTLVDLSWQSFALSAREVTPREAVSSDEAGPTRDPSSDDAAPGVIRLPQEAPRIRR